jgi:hypothetical protein
VQPFAAPLLSSVAFAAFVACLAACNEAQIENAPDASPNCPKPVLESPCKPQGAGSPGCGDDLGTSTIFGRAVVLEGGSFPPGCTVIVNDPTPDQQNQCSQLGTCNCGGDAGAYGWVCVQ